MSEREARLAMNEALFREMNERASDHAEAMDDPGALEVYCECANLDCIERLTLTADEYREARSDPTRFVVSVGHEVLDIEEVVFTTDRFQIVRKRQGAGGVATLLQP
jgi:hypothetical protein